jgi:hypothetical protein
VPHLEDLFSAQDLLAVVKNLLSQRGARA